MRVYPIGLVPGPTVVPMLIREVWNKGLGSSDLEPEFFEVYAKNQELVRELLGAGEDKSVVITSGEAMSILWGGIKCSLKPGDRLLAVAAGLYGEGFADMARSIGIEAVTCMFPFDEIPDPNKVREAALRFRPNVITAVHCETPSGILTSDPVMKEIGKIAHEVGALYVVDFVSSAAGAPVKVDEWGIDVGFLGSQKALSLPATISVSTISPRAWEIFERVNYTGFESYLPWRKVPEIPFIPYTHDWYSVEALHVALIQILKKDGLEAMFERHEKAAKLCRDRGREIGLELYPKDEKFSSPTVTAFKVPSKYTWKALDAKFRENGLVVGGNYGLFDGKVFRIGHMGSQADLDLVSRGMDVIANVLG